MITKIKEYIAFGDFNSRDAGWYLQKREAPTPDEKEIVESIPYMSLTSLVLLVNVCLSQGRLRKSSNCHLRLTRIVRLLSDRLSQA